MALHEHQLVFKVACLEVKDPHNFGLEGNQQLHFALEHEWNEQFDEEVDGRDFLSCLGRLDGFFGNEVQRIHVLQALRAVGVHLMLSEAVLHLLLNLDLFQLLRHQLLRLFSVTRVESLSLLPVELPLHNWTVGFVALLHDLLEGPQAHPVTHLLQQRRIAHFDFKRLG